MHSSENRQLFIYYTCLNVLSNHAAYVIYKTREKPCTDIVHMHIYTRQYATLWNTSEKQKCPMPCVSRVTAAACPHRRHKPSMHHHHWNKTNPVPTLTSFSFASLQPESNGNPRKASIVKAAPLYLTSLLFLSFTYPLRPGKRNLLEQISRREAAYEQPSTFLTPTPHKHDF